MHEERLFERCTQQGAYFHDRLLKLKEKHPKSILEVRGKGLFQALRFGFSQNFAAKVLDISSNDIFRSYQSVMIGALNRELYQRHRVLTHFQPGALDIIHFMPPLIVEKHQIDQVVDGVDEILTRGLAEATINFIVANMKRVLSGG
jgi:putrescine aminotransferase